MAKRKFYPKVEKDKNGLTPKAAASLETVIEKFKTGDLSDLKEIAVLRLPAECPASGWSFRNRILTYLQGNGNMDARTSNQWYKDGYKIKAGSSAVWIFEPAFKKYIKTDKETGEEEERVFCTGFYPTYRFTSDSVEPHGFFEAKPLPDFSNVELPALEKVEKALGVTIKARPVAPDRLGDCSHSGKKINLGTDDPRVYFHELTHAIHAALGWKSTNGKAEATYAEKEIVADFSATVLCYIYGYGDFTGTSWNYIQHYTNDPFESVMAALSIINDVLNFIFELETPELETA